MSNELQNTDQIDERILVQKCADDERSYQEVLYRRYAKSMFRVCRRYANSNDEAMDFLQEGFIEVFRKIKNFRHEGSLEGWVRRVIIFKTIDALRKENRYQEVVSQLEDETVTQAEEFELDGAQLDSDRLRNLVNELPGKASLVLKLYVLEGLTHKEIAEYLDISVGTSKSQLNRARTLLKAELSGNNG